MRRRDEERLGLQQDDIRMERPDARAHRVLSIRQKDAGLGRVQCQDEERTLQLRQLRRAC